VTGFPPSANHFGNGNLWKSAIFSQLGVESTFAGF